MLLRDHPLKSRHGVPNWFPVGTGLGELGNTRPIGKMGVLKSAIPPHIQTSHEFFLCIDFEDSSYIGCLLFNDYASCQQAAEHFLQFYCNRSIADVGLASSFPVVLRLLKKGRKAKGGTKTWKQNKK